MNGWVNTKQGRARIEARQDTRRGQHFYLRGEGFHGWYKAAEIENLESVDFTGAPVVDLEHLPWEPVPTVADNPFMDDTDALDTLHYEDGRATTLTEADLTVTASGDDIPGDWANIELLGEEGTEPDPDDPNPVMANIHSAWSDVQEKAKKLRADMALNVTRDDGDYIEATIRGSSGSYETYVQRHGASSGSYTVTGWGCTCGWGQWAWKRQHTYVGRMCSHALALYLEMQSREYYRNVNNRAARMARIAGKVYTPEEEQELIMESGVASQLNRLRLENSHYLEL